MSKERFAEFFELFSRIEGEIHMIGSSLFSVFPEYNNRIHDLYSLTINYSLHKHSIFSGVEQKVNFLDLFLKGAVFLMTSRNFTDPDMVIISQTRIVLKKLNKIQGVRNKLAHRWIIFMDGDKIRFPSDKFFEPGLKTRDEIVFLPAKIEEAKNVLDGLRSNHIKLVNLLNRYFIAQRARE